MSCVWGVFVLLLFDPALGFDLQIFHTNDLHSRFDEISDTTGVCKENTTCFGGFARVAYFIKENRKNNTIVLNAGDSFQGTPLFVAFGTEILLPMIDLLGIDAMSLGNHEFDRGPRVLKEYINQVKTPVVTCNVNGSKDKDFADAKLKKSVIITVGNVKVGVIGYLLPATKGMATVGNVEITDEIDCIRKRAKEMKNENVHIVIAVGHSGWEKDLEIAGKVEEVDVVVGGHTDTFLYTGTPPSREKPEGPYPTLVEQPSGKLVPAVQAFGYTKYVGVLNLRFDDNTYNLTNATGNPVLITANMTKDQSVTKLLEEFKKNLSTIYKQIVCTTEVNLNGACKRNECNMGDIFTDAAAEFVENNSQKINKEFKTIGLINGGNMRFSLNKSTLDNGQVSYGDLATILPFPNHFLQIRLNGSVLNDIFKISYSKRDLGGFLQMSNMKVTYFTHNKTAKAYVMKRKTGKFKIVDPCKKYDVVVTDYLYKGDGYDFRKGKLIQTFDKPVLDIVKEWMAQNTPINIMESNRIVFNDEVSHVSETNLPAPNSKTCKPMKKKKKKKSPS